TERLLLPVIAGAPSAPPADPRALPVAELVDVVARSAAVKARVVAEDPHESGVRAHLNLGHPLSQAPEAASALAQSHRDAVLHGRVVAAVLGRGRGLAVVVERVAGLVERLGPDPLPTFDLASLAPFLARDKKAVAGRMRFVLLEEVGRPVVVDD